MTKLVAAVRASGVKRYLVVGGVGSLEIAPGRIFVDEPDFSPSFAKPEATKGKENLIYLRTIDDLDWTVLCPSKLFTAGAVPMAHPDPNAPPDLTPIQIGEVWENPLTGERTTVLELAYQNPEGRVTAELVARVGAKVICEHRHPALTERFTVLEGELTMKRGDRTDILRQGETASINANVWHDWWNASDRDARVRVEITPGERFAHMIETFYGLARLGHTDAKGMPYLLQLALSAPEFSDVIVFRSPPLAVQRILFGTLAPLARWRGYRATYPQLSRTVLAPRT